MNYKAHYDRLIDRARGRSLVGYRERHHIQPRCMSGTDAPGNLVDLTAEEHYVAHQLLVKMHPNNRRLAHAANLMARRAGRNKVYGWLRRKQAEAASLDLKGRKLSAERRAAMSTQQRAKPNFKGRKHTVAARAAIGQANRRQPRHTVPHTEEAKRRMALAKLGKLLTAEHKEKIGAAFRGKPLPDWHKAKLSVALKGRVFTPEWRAKLSAARRRNLAKAA